MPEPSVFDSVAAGFVAAEAELVEEQEQRLRPLFLFSPPHSFPDPLLLHPSLSFLLLSFHHPLEKTGPFFDRSKIWELVKTHFPAIAAAALS